MTTLQTQGTVLKVNDGSSPINYLTVGEVREITDLGSGESTKIDTTNLSSTAKEYNLGLKDEGDVRLLLNYDPDDSAQDRLKTLRDSGDLDSFQISLSNSPPETWTFSGRVSQFAINISPDNVVEATVTIVISGAITVA